MFDVCDSREVAKYLVVLYCLMLRLGGVLSVDFITYHQGIIIWIITKIITTVYLSARHSQ